MATSSGTLLRAMSSRAGRRWNDTSLNWLTAESDCLVDVDTNRYSVPWGHVGKRVRVQVTETEVVIFHSDVEVARHALHAGRHQRVTREEHYRGILYREERGDKEFLEREAPRILPMDELARPLSEYEEAVSAV